MSRTDIFFQILQIQPHPKISPVLFFSPASNLESSSLLLSLLRRLTYTTYSKNCILASTAHHPPTGPQNKKLDYQQSLPMPQLFLQLTAAHHWALSQMTTGGFLSQSLIEHVHNKNCFQNVKIFNDALGSMASIPGPALWIILISRSRISTKVELNDRKSGLVSQVAFISQPLADIGSITVAKAWGLDTSTLKQNYGKLENMDYKVARMIERSYASVRSGLNIKNKKL